MSRKLLGRVAKLTIKDRVVKYPDLELDFELNFDTESDGNAGNITLYNLSDKTLKVLKKGNSFSFEAGYKDDLGLIAAGQIEKSNTKFQRGDKVTEVVVNDNIQPLLDTFINQTWREKINASDVVEDIVNQIGLSVGNINPGAQLSYGLGKIFFTKAKRALEELADDTLSKFHISRGKIYFRSENAPERIRKINLSSDTGLIASPQRMDSDNEERWKVQCLLDYRIEPDVVLDIESNTINGEYRVVEGTHSGDWTTEVEVVKYET